MKNRTGYLRSWPLPCAALLALIIACSPGSGAQAQGEAPALALEEVASGLQSPTTITHAGDGSGRLFIVEQPGRIRIVEGGALVDTPFLDLTGNISSGGERGLLGLAFHPEFEENGLFFVNYTDSAGHTVVERYAVSTEDPNSADMASALQVLTVPQPYPNHNGGGLAFGPDGYLYISLGDGGAGGDPHNHGQNLGTLLGTLLRIDVSGEEPYAVPADNPFVDTADAQPEIWAYGLRNPWRFSFDRETGDLWIADVGQNLSEEIHFQSADSAGGENYGWKIMEGAHCFEPAEGCDTTGLEMPVMEYDHQVGCSVTGGYVYRGQELAGLTGVYLFGDYCSGIIWGGSANGDGTWSSEELLSTNFRISAFGEDESGEIYVADHQGGVIHRIVAGE